jgi:FkbM family methyltransferase
MAVFVGGSRLSSTAKERQQMSKIYDELNKHVKNLHEGKVVVSGKEMSFFYVGKEEEFKNLMVEMFEQNVYGAGVDKDRKDMVIVDAGAYIGDSAFYFYPYAKKIYAIEPGKEAFEILNANIKVNKIEDKVETFNFALANTNGKRHLYRTSADTEVGVTLIPFTADKGGFEVDCQTIEKFFEDNKIEHVDLLKMDIEGAEYEIFESEGFGKVADKIDKIIIEAHPFTVPGAMAGTTWKIPYLLSKYGFETKLAPSTGSWRVQVVYTDGHKEWVPMQIFVSERKK